MIQISNLSKVFDADSKSPVYALNHINLEIDSGEIFGIIGLSGAGKSTLIRTINRLEDPTTGRISIDGVDITALSKSELMEARREIGMIFQHFNLLSSRSVAGNVAFPLEVSGMAKSEIENRVSELLKLVGLSDKADSYPSQLSGGQKQRVAIARALANNPKVLLCDEATSALDPNTTKSILKLLKDINKSIGLTIVLITHQMEVIREICNRVAIIEGGEIIELGKVESVFSNPKTQTAKDFIAHLTPEDTVDNFFPKETGSTVIRITYLGESAQKPVVSGLIRKFDIDVNIISGDVNKLMSTSVGHLMIQLLGSKEEIERSIDYLNGMDLSVEVIWNA